MFQLDPQYVMAAGTLEYAAPETLPKRDAEGRLKREALYSHAADVWSIGAILFLLLTGEQLVDLDRLRSSTAEFQRMMKAVVGGVERDLLDETAAKVRDQQFLDSRLKRARALAPPAACELLEQMLVLEPTKRITATQALKDRFVTDSYLRVPRGHGVFDAEIIPKMRRFAEAPALRRLAVLVEAHLLGPQDDGAPHRHSNSRPKFGGPPKGPPPHGPPPQRAPRLLQILSPCQPSPAGACWGLLGPCSRVLLLLAEGIRTRFESFRTGVTSSCTTGIDHWQRGFGGTC